MDDLDSFNLDQSRPLDGLVELLGKLAIAEDAGSKSPYGHIAADHYCRLHVLDP